MSFNNDDISPLYDGAVSRLDPVSPEPHSLLVQIDISDQSMGHISKALLLLTSYLALTWGQGLNVCEYFLNSSLHSHLSLF